MGKYWLHDLPSVLADTPNVTYYYGWETRSRSSGGYDGLLGIAIHHTASSASPDDDKHYMWEVSSDRPVGAIYLARDGSITVGAAGATNTQGKGGPLNLTKGTVPLDKGNANMIAIEAANAGTGEPWPDVQQQAYLTLVRALCQGYNIQVSDVFGHYDYCAPSCPGRKIDPAGPSQFGTVNPSQTWDINAFRSALAISPPIPTPAPGPPGTGYIGDPMFCEDEDTADFWIVAVDWEGEWASPIGEIPQIDWRKLGPISDILNGPLKKVPHQYLQDIYDKRGRPATP